MQNRVIQNIHSVIRVSKHDQFPPVYAVKFNDTTECSAAMDNDFKATQILVDEIDKYSEGIEEFIKKLDANGGIIFHLGTYPSNHLTI